jgi:hypothetical protein
LIEFVREKMISIIKTDFNKNLQNRIDIYYKKEETLNNYKKQFNIISEFRSLMTVDNLKTNSKQKTILKFIDYF